MIAKKSNLIQTHQKCMHLHFCSQLIIGVHYRGSIAS